MKATEAAVTEPSFWALITTGDIYPEELAVPPLAAMGRFEASSGGGLSGLPHVRWIVSERNPADALSRSGPPISVRPSAPAHPAQRASDVAENDAREDRGVSGADGAGRGPQTLQRTSPPPQQPTQRAGR